MNLHINKRKRDIMKGKKLLVTLAASALLFAGCGLKGNNVVIKVNDKKITQSEFDKQMDIAFKGSMFAQMGIDYKDEKNAFLANILKQRVVNELIVKALIDSEIEKRGIKVSNGDVEEGIKEVIEKVGSKEQLDTILKQNGISPSQFKKDIAEQVRIEKMAEQLGDSNVTDADAKNFYDKNIEKFKYPDQVRASHILIVANQKELEALVNAENKGKELTDAERKALMDKKLDEKRRTIEEIHKELSKDLTKFAKIAKEKSEDPGSAVKGGDLGFFPKGRMVKDFEDVAFSLKPNTLSGIVRSQYGYHIILVTDRKAAGQEPYEKVKDSIKAYLKKDKQIKYVDDLVESLKKNATIEFVDSSLNPENIQDAVKKQLEADEQAAAAPEAPKAETVKK